MTDETIQAEATLTVLGAMQASALLHMFKQDPGWTLVDHQWDPQRCIPDSDPPICPICGACDHSESCYVEHWANRLGEAHISRFTCGEHIWTRLRMYSD